jgi:hypothetical protein
MAPRPNRGLAKYMLGIKRIKKSTVILSAANLVGVLIIFGSVASICQQAKIEQGIYYDAGDSFEFLATAMPILFICLLLDAGWGIKASVDIYRRKDYQASIALAVVASIWAVVIHRFVI